jgi:hypothetical protein
MRIIVSVSALLASCIVSQADVSLLTGSVVYSGNGHSYYLTSLSTWTDAEAYATSIGGHLVTLRNAQEDSWVYSTFIGVDGSQNLWYGLNDAKTEGTFVWSSGETSTYRNWGSTEPSNTGGSEDYVRCFEPSSPNWGKWNDAGNTELANGVIEVVPEPSTLAILGLASLTTLPVLSRTNRKQS